MTNEELQEIKEKYALANRPHYQLTPQGVRELLIDLTVLIVEVERLRAELDSYKHPVRMKAVFRTAFSPVEPDIVELGND